MEEMNEKLKLLFVTNDPDLKTHVEQSIYGYPATQKISSYVDGLTVFKAFSPKIVFVDFSTHLEDGISFLEEVEKNCSAEDLSFILVIGNEEKARIETMLSLKPHDFLMKPFLKAELLRRIEINRKIVELLSKSKKCERLKSIVRTARKTGHDINNPLTTVIGISDLLLEDKLGEQHMKMVGMIRKESLKIATLVDEMMMTSDSERGR
jgi:DNA-binding response OmpR family regulator